ncbi:XrtA/PEP-CTERM system TPR-repeat protein PrsT [Aquabacterium lacunae]|uniref:XrtA/PEP-CTERM system TPR-repeat protein PrsT n=1 Tax=Aquabacterium lacunae TaxID=2528630 RepID=UPI00315DE130
MSRFGGFVSLVFQTRRSVWLAVWLVCGSLIACSGSDPAELMSSAKAYAEKRDHAAAVIQLKNLIQQQPDSAEARWLLAQSLQATGDAVGAESEYRKALSLGYSPDLVVPRLVETMLVQLQHQKVVDQFARQKLSTPKAQTDLLVLVAEAHLGLNRGERAQEVVDAALQLQPEHAGAKVFKARFLAGARKYDEADALLASVLKQYPDDADAWKLKGDLYHYGLKRSDEALEAYRKAVEVKPRARDALVGIVRVHLSLGRVKEASEALGQLQKLDPGLPFTQFMEAQVAFAANDLPKTREILQKLLIKSPDNPQVQELAGVVEFKSGALLQAEPLLRKAVKASPNSTVARRLLMLTYMQLGQVDKAIDLVPEDVIDSSDSDLIAAAGQAYLLQGSQDKADALLRKAAGMTPNDPAKQTALAVSRLQGGETEQGIQDLRRIAATDTGVMADMALINTLVQKGDLAGALKALDQLQGKRKDDPMPVLLRSRVLMLKGDAAGSRQVLQAAIAQHPKFFPLVKALVAQDVLEKKLAEAESKVAAFLATEPKHSAALMAFAELKAVRGAAPSEVVAQLQKAIDASPDVMEPRLALVSYQLRQKDVRGALSTAQAALAAAPDNVRVIEALAAVQVAAGEHNQALSSYGKIAAKAPESGMPHVQIASVHAAAKNWPAARDSLNKALEVEPQLLAAQTALVNVNIQLKRIPEALAVARQVQSQRPKQPVGFVLEGDLQVQAGQPAQAVAPYRTASGLQPELTTLAVKLDAALRASGQVEEADKVSAQRMREHPKDWGFLTYMGERALAENRYPLAEKLYAAVVAAQPNNVMALNNLAWAQGKQGKSEALLLVQKADKLAPKNPMVLDTWAMLLAEGKQWAKALELQKQVVQLQPSQPELKLALARYQLASGDKNGARETLSVLRKLGSEFKGQAEVEGLWKQL